MELRLPRWAGSRDHGYAAEFDADLDGADDVVLHAGGLVGLLPLFAVRLALWMERQRQAGRSVEVMEPEDAATRRCFRAFGLGKDIGGVEEALVEDDADVIIRPTRLGELTEVDELADKLLQPLIDQFDDGIPEHIRRSHPEFVVDEHAIGQALEEGVSGTQRSDRGYGFSWVLKETLASAASSAEMLIRAGHGTFRREIVDARVKDDGWNAPSTQGTWIACDWTTVGRPER